MKSSKQAQKERLQKDNTLRRSKEEKGQGRRQKTKISQS